MRSDRQVATVIELQRKGILRVEDGNHGENRPRRDEFVQHGVAFIRAADMEDGRVLFDSASRINDQALQRIVKGIGAPGDVLLSHKGTVGKVAFVPMNAPPFVCSPQTTFWRSLNPNILDRRYLYFYLRSPAFQQQLKTRAGETDMAPYVSLTSQRALALALPPIGEQHSITRVLTALDDRIGTNQRMVKTLEAIARSTFEHWFVDFEFPNASGTSYLDSGGKFEYNQQLGKRIPKTWQVRSIDGVATFLNGLAMQRYPNRDNEVGLPVVKIRELKQGITASTERASSGIPKEYIVDDGDILFSWSGSLEATVWTSGRGALNQHLFKATSTEFPKWFYYQWILRYLPEYRRIAKGKATTMGHIQRHHLRSSLVLVPDEITLRRMDKIQSPLLAGQVQLGVSARIFAQMRDLLLPSLMSGRIRPSIEAR